WSRSRRRTLSPSPVTLVFRWATPSRSRTLKAWVKPSGFRFSVSPGRSAATVVLRTSSRLNWFARPVWVSGIASSTASGISLSSGANVRKSVLTVGSATLAAVVVGGTVYVATGSTTEPLYDTTQPNGPQYACVDEDGSLAYFQTRRPGDPGWSDAAYFCWDGEGGLTRWAFPYETPTGACEDPSYYRPECGYVEETFVRQSKDWDPSYTVLSWKGNDPAARVVFEHNGVEYPAARDEGTDNVFSAKVQR